MKPKRKKLIKKAKTIALIITGIVAFVANLVTILAYFGIRPQLTRLEDQQILYFLYSILKVRKFQMKYKFSWKKFWKSFFIVNEVIFVILQLINWFILK